MATRKAAGQTAGRKLTVVSGAVNKRGLVATVATGSLVSIVIFYGSVIKWDYPTVITAMTPWLSLVGPIIAAALVMVGWQITHRQATDRDLLSWRRTNLPEIVQELVDASNKRQKELNLHLSQWEEDSQIYIDYDKHNRMMTELRRILQKLEVNSQGSELHKAAQNLVQAHSSSDHELKVLSSQLEGLPYGISPAKMLDELDDEKSNRLYLFDPTTEELTNRLIRALQSTLGYEQTEFLTIAPPRIVTDIPTQKES